MVGIMSPLQSTQGWPYARASTHGADLRTLRAEQGRIPDPVQPQHPRGSDGLPCPARTTAESRAGRRGQLNLSDAKSQRASRNDVTADSAAPLSAEIDTQ